MKNKFYLIILFVLCLLVLVSCGDNTHSSKPTVSPTKQPVEEAVDVYLKAANDLEKNDFIDYKMIYDMDIVSSDEETNLLMNTRVRENDRHSEAYVFESNAELSIGTTHSSVSIVYIDGAYYQEMDDISYVTYLTYPEFCQYMLDSNETYFNVDDFIAAYKKFEKKESDYGVRIDFSQCDAESEYIKEDIITAMSVCGFDINYDQFTIISSEGFANNRCLQEECTIDAKIMYAGEEIEISLHITMQINSTGSKNDISKPKDTSTFKEIPSPSFPTDLHEMFTNLTNKKSVKLSMKNDAKFVINNVSATYNDSMDIEYKSDEDTEFSNAFKQVIKCSKLSPKTTTYTFSEKYSSATGKYNAVEDGDKQPEKDITYDEAIFYLENTLSSYAPECAYFSSISSEYNEVTQETVYTFELSKDYVHAYCAYYMTYFDNSLSMYPYYSTAIDFPEGKIILTVDTNANVVKHMESQMSCKYNYQSKYTISFDYTSEIEVTLTATV